MPAIQSEVITRRNGATAACEPCRIRKLACDHGEPVCARCIKRGKSELCAYHPAPMVGMKRRRTQPQHPSTDGLSPTQAATSRASAPNAPTNSQALQLADQAPVHSIPDQDEYHMMPPEESRPGYLGATSFISSLAESSKELERDNSQGSDAARVIVSLRDVPTSIAAADIEAGAAVLSTFFPCRIADGLIDKEPGHCFPFTPRTILLECWRSLRSILVPLEGCEDRHKKLQELSRQIFRNTMQVLQEPGQVSMKTYAGVFTGQNLRWESVGVVLTSIGAQLMRSMNMYSSTVITGAKSTKESIKWLADASNRCLAFCDDLNLVNDMTLWLIMDNQILISQFFGDTSYLHWKRLGDLSTCIFAMGLHICPPQIYRPDSRVPRWLVEIRQTSRLFAFYSDLNLSMFMGRPPRLSSRYCSFETLPLELSASELALEPADLEVAVRKLTPEGTRPVVDITLRSVRIRETYPILRLREEILEVCLGIASDTESRGRIGQLIKRSRHLWDSRRKEFQYDTKIWSSQIPQKNCHLILELYLEHLYNDFLIQRVRVQRFKADPEELLVIAGDLLANTLYFLGKESDPDIDWILALYSLPAAGVLALELLKQHTRPDYRPPPRAPKRSQVVQNMSVLIGALKWISREGVGNYSLGKQACATLQRVLDRVLNPESIPAHVVQKVQHQGQRQQEQTQQQPQQQLTPQDESGFNAAYSTPQSQDVDASASANDAFWETGGLSMPDGPGLPWIGQTDFDEAFWLGLEEHPLLEDRGAGLNFVDVLGNQ